MAWSFPQTCVSVNHRLEHQILEVRAHLVHHLIRQPQARVVHGQQNALHFKGRIQLCLDNFHGVQQFAQALQGKVLTLNRHHHAVCCCQCIQRQQAKTGGAIQDDEIVPVTDSFQGMTQFALTAFRMDQLNLCTYEVEVGGQHIKVGGRGWNDAILHVDFAGQHLVGTCGHLTGFDPDPT